MVSQVALHYLEELGALLLSVKRSGLQGSRVPGPPQPLPAILGSSEHFRAEQGEELGSTWEEWMQVWVSGLVGTKVGQVTVAQWHMSEI